MASPSSRTKMASTSYAESGESSDEETAESRGSGDEDGAGSGASSDQDGSENGKPIDDAAAAAAAGGASGPSRSARGAYPKSVVFYTTVRRDTGMGYRPMLTKIQCFA